MDLYNQIFCFSTTSSKFDLGVTLLDSIKLVGMMNDNFPKSEDHGLLYICYTYSDIEVNLCLKALVTHLAIRHVARARVILV